MQAVTFLSALFTGYDDPRLRCEIRTLCPKWRAEQTSGLTESHSDGTPPRTGPRSWYPLDRLEMAGRQALSLSHQWEVYVGVLPRLGCTGGRYDVPSACWLWCDVDGGEEGVEAAISRVKRSGLPKPHLVVMSGGGLHCYFRLAAQTELPDRDACDRFKAVLKRLVRAIGGTPPGAHADSSRADTASILRVPGTFNLKRETQPRPVRLLRCAPAEETFTLAWWRANLPAEPCPVAPASGWRERLPGEVLPLPPLTVQKIQNPAPEGQRHLVRKQIAASCAMCGFDEEAIRLLLDHQANVCGSPESVKRVNQNLARWAVIHAG
jgi:hypothetical protein